MSHLVVFVQNGGIDENCAVDFQHAIGFVDVATGVNSGFDALDGCQQVVATCGKTVVAAVEDTACGAVGYQHVDAVGDFVPVVADVCAALAVECPVEKFWLDGRTPEPHAVNFHPGIIQIDEAVIVQVAFSFFAAMVFKTFIVVAGNHDFVGEILRGHEAGEVLRIAEVTASGEVTAMYQHVAAAEGWHPVMQGMGVGDESQFHQKFFTLTIIRGDVWKLGLENKKARELPRRITPLLGRFKV